MYYLYLTNDYLLRIGHCDVSLIYKIRTFLFHFTSQGAKISVWGSSTPSFLVPVVWEAWIQPELEGWAHEPGLGHGN